MFDAIEIQVVEAVSLYESIVRYSTAIVISRSAKIDTPIASPFASLFSRSGVNFA